MKFFLGYPNTIVKKISRILFSLTHLLIIASFILSAAVPVSSAIAYSNSSTEITVDHTDSLGSLPTSNKFIELSNSPSGVGTQNPIRDNYLSNDPIPYTIHYQQTITKPYYEILFARTNGVILPNKDDLIGFALQGIKANINPVYDPINGKENREWCNFQGGPKPGLDNESVLPSTQSKEEGIFKRKVVLTTNVEGERKNFIDENFPGFSRETRSIEYLIDHEPLYVDWEGYGYGSNDCILDIWGIYYGVPPALKDQSILSSNQPKNGVGDPRECPINGCSGAQAQAGDPINTRTGNFDYSSIDLSLQTIAGPLSFQRSYASLAIDTNQYPTDLGRGWTHNQAIRLIIDNNSEQVLFKAHTNNQYLFTDYTVDINQDRTYVPYLGVTSDLRYTSATQTYRLTASDKSIYEFNNDGFITSWKNKSGYEFVYSYISGKLDKVIEPKSKRGLKFSYTQDGLVDTVTIIVDDQIQNGHVSFTYTNGNLSTYTDTRNKTWTYIYGDGTTTNDLNRLVKIKNPENLIELTNWYDAQGRAFEQYNGKNERIVRIEFDDTGTTTDPDFPGGLVYINTIKDALDRSSKETYGTNNLLVRQENSSGFKTYRSYDPNFRLHQVTDQSGRSSTYNWSGDGGNLTYMQDTSGTKITLAYDPANSGQLVSAITADANNTIQRKISYGYINDNLTSTTRSTTKYGAVTSSYVYTDVNDPVPDTNPVKYQPENLIKTVTDPLNHTNTFIYDEIGQLSFIHDAKYTVTQKETKLTYDNLGRVTDVTDPKAIKTHYEYDQAGNVLKVIQNYIQGGVIDSKTNVTTNLQYDDQGRLYLVTNAEGFTTTYQYDGAGLLYQVIHPHKDCDTCQSRNLVTTYEYNATGQATTVTDPMQHQIHYEYDTATDDTPNTNTGQLLRVKDHLGQVATIYSYTLNGNIDTVTRPTPKGDYKVKYYYDNLDRVVAVSDNYKDENYNSSDTCDQTSTCHLQSLGYDDFGNLNKAIDAFGRVTVYNYDELNLLEAVTQNYVLNGTETDANVITSYVYDKLGNLKSITDAKQQTTTYDYDVLNRLWKITNALTKVVEFGYDELGNRTSVKDPDQNETHFGFDPLNRLEYINYPDGPAEEAHFDYDALGQLTVMTSFMNDSQKQTTFDYDDLGRTTSITDPFYKTISYGYDDNNKRTSITYPSPSSKTIVYQYNDLDQLDIAFDGQTLLADYNYNSAGQLTDTQLPNNVRTTYGYDLSGQLSDISNWKSIGHIDYHYDYDLVGNPKRTIETRFDPLKTLLPLLLNDSAGEIIPEEGVSIIGGEENGLPSPLPFGPYPAPLENLLAPQNPGNEALPYPGPELDAPISSTSGSNKLLAFFEPVIKFIASLFLEHTPTVSAHSDYALAYPGPGEPGPTPGNVTYGQTTVIDYQYDGLYRLTDANYTYYDNAAQTFHYAYDEVGNRSSQTIDNVTTTYQYDAANRLKSVNNGSPYTWDDNGNLKSDGANSYNYDYANRLIGMNGGQNSYSYSYDGLGNRYQQTLNSSTTTYTLDLAAGLPQVLSDGNYTYLYGLGRVAQQNSQDTNYFLTDALGSVRQMVNTSGVTTLDQSFDPFGNLLGQPTPQTTSAYGYAGEWTDANGLQNLRARYYAPSQGRFISSDPFPGFLSQPSTLNQYTYVTNNPVLMTDPSGQIAPLLAIAGFSGLLSAAINIGSQLSTMQQTSVGQAFRCLNWKNVGIALGVGAIAGLAGFGMFGGALAFAEFVGWGTGLGVYIGSGVIAGIISGQYARLAGLVLTNRTDQASSVMFQWKDILVDGILGGLGGAIGYGLQRGLSGIAEDVLQNVTDSANQRLSSNPSIARNVLSSAEYAAGQRSPRLANMEYGNALERMVSQQIRGNSLLRSLIEHIGGPNNPDFVGRGLFNGLRFDITTNTTASISNHLSRAYGQGLIIPTYSRPIGFGVFP